MVALLLAVTVGVYLTKAGFMLGLIVIGLINGALAGWVVYNLLFFNTESFWLLTFLVVLGATA